MTGYLKLDSYVLDGRGIAAVNCEITVNGTRVSILRPFVEIGPYLAVTPQVTADGEGIRIRLDAWAPMKYGHDGPVIFLPLVTSTQGGAVAAARAFEADPAITWSAPFAELMAWCQRWSDAYNAAERGERT
ncbi:hypothetical protein SAMN05421837_10538 [Amycolatopsis pretoriensis]|uniref:Uncharacterized protein n=1 Tax=Amycolatopsis pretoriensis TaxID=218821 RepID=A0A1H5QYA0_9PSEU|nr:hypothetical protein [Amycolatopsis pretoriensis]SEF30167.1 hypothetical protein SAMN05421837_10538 [Amycolatopsis pretoriensis]